MKRRSASASRSRKANTSTPKRSREQGRSRSGRLTTPESCFGSGEWPADVVRPQAWLEFDVEDVDAATRELEERGYRLLVRNRTEPWSQVVTRLISPEGLLVGVTMTPWMRKPA